MTWCALCIVNLPCELNALLVSHTCVMILVPEIVSVVMFCLLVCLKRKQILEKSTMLYMIHEHNIYQTRIWIRYMWLAFFVLPSIKKNWFSYSVFIYIFFFFSIHVLVEIYIYIYIYIYICVKYCK